jgi:phosphoserine phosphatase
MSASRVLLTLTGQDRPGLASAFFASIDALSASIVDVGQITIRGHLVVCVEVEAHEGVSHEDFELALASITKDEAVAVTVSVAEDVLLPQSRRLLVTVLAMHLEAKTLQACCAAIASCGGNIERIVRLADYPVMAYEFVVQGSDHNELRAAMTSLTTQYPLDIAVQRAGLHRRAKRLIVMDADSTLLQGEVIDQLAAHAGLGEQVAEITEAAMAGELDFSQALERRVALLKGLPAIVLDEVRESLQLMPGARTLLRTLRRLGYQAAVVSGGFLPVIAPLMEELGITMVAANGLEIVDGVLTGKVEGAIVDRAGKVTALKAFAAQAGVAVGQTVAIGDGANDIDMLGAAGLGIAFNARPVVREAADTALSVPFLDAVLFLLGISREEIEAADADLG